LRNTEGGGIDYCGVEAVVSSVCAVNAAKPFFDLLPGANWSFEESNDIFQKNRSWQECCGDL
jgi:hypothetical protein